MAEDAQSEPVPTYGQGELDPPSLSPWCHQPHDCLVISGGTRTPLCHPSPNPRPRSEQSLRIFLIFLIWQMEPAQGAWPHNTHNCTAGAEKGKKQTPKETKNQERGCWESKCPAGKGDLLTYFFSWFSILLKHFNVFKTVLCPDQQ